MSTLAQALTDARRQPRPILLDVFSGAGGAADGYVRAGFYVVGVDNVPQPNYGGDAFVQMDAFDALAYGDLARRGVRAIHASPPCPHYSVLNRSWNVDPQAHPDWIGRTRDALRLCGLPYVIENVVGARKVMRADVKLCGSMFGLPVERHRLFECEGFTTPEQPKCRHDLQRTLWPDGFPPLRSERAAQGKRARVVGVYGTGGGDTKDLALWKWAMDTPWMRTKREVSDAVPPAYTTYIGDVLMSDIEHGACPRAIQPLSYAP